MSTDGSEEVRLLTNSRISCFKECSQRHYFRYELGMEPHKKAKALVFGTAVHKSLEVYWKARQARAKDPINIGLSMLPTDDLTPFDLAKARVMLMAYSVVWDRVPCRVIGVEVGFDIPLTDPKNPERQSQYWRKAGKIDLIVELGDGRVALIEHKTSSEDPSPGGAYASRLTMDEQISYYMLAANHLKIKPDVIVYDVLRKPQIDPKEATEKVRYKKNGEPYKGTRTEDETPEQYEERVLEAIQKDIDRYIVRIPVYRFESELQNFHQEVWNQSRVMRFTIDNGFHTKNSRACAKHYGSTCPYLDVCRGQARIEDPNLFYKMDDVHPELEHRGRT